MQNFLNTAFGSMLKVLITLLLTQVLLEIQQGKTIMDIFHGSNLNSFLTLLATSTIPILINWWNPKDPRYGNKPAPPDFKPENN